MILSGSTIKSTAHAVKMARHLWKDENEDIIVRENFDAGKDYESFKDSLVEMQLYTLQTKGNTGIFHVAISPRENDKLEEAQYNRAIEIIENKMKLNGQNRLRVDHVKEGRAHSHLFWSLVKENENKLIPLPLYKRKLQKCADEMTDEFGLKEVNRAPNEQTIEVTHADRMRANRAKQEGQKIKPYQDRKREIAALWEQTKTSEEFLNKVRSAGYGIGVNETYGEKSNRKRSRYVLLDQNGNEYNLARELPRLVKQKHIRDRLVGHKLLSVEQARAALSDRQYYNREQDNIDRQNRELDAADQAAKEKAKQVDTPVQQDFNEKSNSELKEKNKEQKPINQKSIKERFEELGRQSGVKKLREKTKERKEEKAPIDIATAQSNKWFDIIDRDRKDSAKISVFENKLRKDHRFEDLEEKIKKLKKDLAQSDTFLGRKTGKYQNLLNELEDHQTYFEETKQRIEAQVDKLKRDLIESRLPELRPANDAPESPEPEKDKSDSIADFEAAAKKKSERQAKEEEFKERMRRDQERKAQERDKDKGMDLDI